jgi:hypothetical protein
MARAIADTDNYQDRLVKLIPSELVAAYTTIQGLLTSQGSSVYQPALAIIAALLAFVGVPLYLMRAMGVKSWGQIGLTVVAFLIWVYCLGGSNLWWVAGWYTDYWGSVAMILFTLFMPVIYR